MKLFFVCNNSPNQFKAWLKDESTLIKKPSKRCDGIVLLIGLANNKTLIESMLKSTAKVVVFDGPITAMSYESNRLDIANNNVAPFYGIEFKKLDRSLWKRASDVESLQYKKYDHQAAIIEAIGSKSLLNSLMTAIYKLAISSQKQVKEALINWLFFDGNVNNIRPLLNSIAAHVKISQDAIEKLHIIMCSDLAQTYYDALKQKKDVDELAKEYELSSYDLRYMLSQKMTKLEYNFMLRRKNI